MKIPQFIILIAIVALVIMAVGYGAVVGLEWPYQPHAILSAVGVALFPTILAYSLTFQGLDKDTTRFIGFLGVGMLGKMLIGILSILFVAVQFKEVRDEYVVTYIIAYFVFTSFEVYGLIRKLRPKF
jgi:drug/metabolite transporter (DMT)-like permease